MLKAVANILGVELGEDFFDEEGNKYFIDLYSLWKTKDKLAYSADNDRELGEFLTGKRKVVKLPWKPKYGQTYYRPDLSEGKPWLKKETWGTNLDQDEITWKMGLACKTGADALRLAEVIKNGH